MLFYKISVNYVPTFVIECFRIWCFLLTDNFLSSSFSLIYLNYLSLAYFRLQKYSLKADKLWICIRALDYFFNFYHVLVVQIHGWASIEATHILVHTKHKSIIYYEIWIKSTSSVAHIWNFCLFSLASMYVSFLYFFFVNLQPQMLVQFYYSSKAFIWKTCEWKMYMLN